MAKAATERMQEHRKKMQKMGFAPLQTHVPEDVVALIDQEQQLSGLRSRGHQIASHYKELIALRQFKANMEGATAS